MAIARDAGSAACQYSLLSDDNTDNADHSLSHPMCEGRTTPGDSLFLVGLSLPMYEGRTTPGGSLLSFHC